jgi:hypothetical protein
MGNSTQLVRKALVPSAGQDSVPMGSRYRRQPEESSDMFGSKVPPLGPRRREFTRGALGLVSLLLLVVFTGCAATTRPVTRFALGNPVGSGGSPRESGGTTGQPVQGYSVPGRKPDSEMPWELFLGNAAHRIIAYVYGVEHPWCSVFYNKETISRVLREAGGDLARLRENEGNQRADIADVTDRILFEVKPWNERGLEEGRQKVSTYLSLFNRAMFPNEGFSAGRGFHGEILIRFARGQHIWRLEWQTTEPGVTQYRWTRSRERFESEAAAYQAGQWVELTEQEMRQYGGWVAQAVEGMVSRRERLASFSGVIGIFIDVIGKAAVGTFSSVILGHMGSGPSAQQPPKPPPNQVGGQVIPFPSRTPPVTPPARLPAASGR